MLSKASVDSVEKSTGQGADLSGLKWTRHSWVISSASSLLLDT